MAVASPSLPDLHTAAPPEFDGPLMASIVRCGQPRARPLIRPFGDPPQDELECGLISMRWPGLPDGKYVQIGHNG